MCLCSRGKKGDRVPCSHPGSQRATNSDPNFDIMSRQGEARSKCSFATYSWGSPHRFPMNTCDVRIKGIGALSQFISGNPNSAQQQTCQYLLCAAVTASNGSDGQWERPLNTVCCGTCSTDHAASLTRLTEWYFF